MWTDHETGDDYLNFGGVARTVAEIVIQADQKPISIGVSGPWGVGKSSMIRLIEKELQAKNSATNKFIFVEFNAWLYQGYDDARAALIEVVAESLAEHAKDNETHFKKAKDLLARVNWFRVAKYGSSAVAMAFGVPPVGMIGDAIAVGKTLWNNGIDGEALQQAEKVAQEAGEAAAGMVKSKEKTSPPQQIHALRQNLEEVLNELNVTLVVLIDDLDRCLPETTISTLEAIRLLLFMKHTAFVIAADDQMIKHAVKKHFQGVDDTLVTNYFDKLIQVPIRVPPLGVQEVRAYMMLLFISDNAEMSPEAKEHYRASICEQLSKAWQGKRADLTFIRTLKPEVPTALLGRLDVADRLAPMMAKASGIAGNPRLVKRFLNAISIRMAMSRAQGVGVDEAVLAKVLLFERCGNPTAYSALTGAVTESSEGKPTFLDEWENKLAAGQELTLPSPWDEPFVNEWLLLPPRLADQDLRGVLYVSREHAPLVLAEDRLSSTALDLLNALLSEPKMAMSFKARLKTLAKSETAVLMDRLLERARREQEWGTPDILEACLALSQVDPPQGSRLSAFLGERPGAQIKPNIIPKISDEPWAPLLFQEWDASEEVAQPVKRAIKMRTAK